MAGDYIRYLWAYDAWANTEVIACLEEHPELADLTGAGAFGTPEETMSHLLIAEASYLNRLANGPLGRPDPPPMRVAEMRAFAAALELTARELLASFPPADHVFQRSYGKVLAETVFGQLVQHGIEHRAQVCGIIGAAGREPPDLSSWRFGGAV